ncbi:hypothetical protein PROSTU_04514 [Providencia stuartii ATCC 25827]|uniref:Uncharacterized protein n=1 Tax=Providencia stuartii ATCC 25827 TaxID=471874 RepID=A0AA87CS66_PROST|nr:hypothetical protein PROSTU_04514 [Providencia stuartii ATCC 25827]
MVFFYQLSHGAYSRTHRTDRINQYLIDYEVDIGNQTINFIIIGAYYFEN